jgi:aldehyde dehydrogenase (NAD+)
MSYGERIEPRLFIDGKLVDAAGGATSPNVDPTTEAVLGDAADATAACTTAPTCRSAGASSA